MPINDLMQIKPPVPMFPWEYHSEDRWAAQEAVKTLYASLQIPAPRMAWCPSPAAMHRASRMLRTIQHGTSYAMCQALVPAGGDAIDREARISLLAALIDPDVSTQSGGLLISAIESVFGHAQRSGEFISLCDLRDLLCFAENDPSGTVAPAGFREQSLWPAFYPQFTAPRLAMLRTQAIIIMPFTKICWLCRPPLFIRTDGDRRLRCADGPAARWSDGFEVFCDRTPIEKLKAGETLALPAGDQATS